MTDDQRPPTQDAAPTNDPPPTHDAAPTNDPPPTQDAAPTANPPPPPPKERPDYELEFGYRGGEPYDTKGRQLIECSDHD
ncbi:MAG: hypothetical protein M3P26_04185 [Gemmatimonadota bacterium]|nr:hypothetical protein [Gemmatimonadota bacterium]